MSRASLSLCQSRGGLLGRSTVLYESAAHARGPPRHVPRHAETGSIVPLNWPIQEETIVRAGCTSGSGSGSPGVPAQGYELGTSETLSHRRRTQ